MTKKGRNRPQAPDVPTSLPKPEPLVDLLAQWYRSRNWHMYDFQQACAAEVEKGKSGMLVAPTGSGKTLALGLPLILHAQRRQNSSGLRILWITPLRALSNDIAAALDEAANELLGKYRVGCRNGDTSEKERTQQKKKAPDLLVTTPESLHLMLSRDQASAYFGFLDAVVIDEWHELIGSKRGVMMELALSRLKGLRPELMIWGISASIGNLEDATQVLLGDQFDSAVLVRGNIQKKIKYNTLIPEEVERYPWAGHLGIRMLDHLIPVIRNAGSLLIFTNTRSQAEIWYQHLLEAMPELAGQLAMHHGSLSRETRLWVENALHAGQLKAVVCTSSLDLGVDFQPVDQVIQIGSPKGVARYVQRAGRSGHKPEEESIIWFLPTHSLEILEAHALKTAATDAAYESRLPLVRCFDVLMQYCMTLACGEGLDEARTFEEVRSTFAFSSLDRQEWEQGLAFLVEGGKSLEAYEDYKKMERNEQGLHKIASRRMAMRHRLSIGAIAGDHHMSVKWLNGGRLGSIEEWFISKLKEGDAFVFAGQVLELVRTEGMNVLVKRSKAKKAIVPSWMGGRMSLSSEVSDYLLKSIQQEPGAEPELLAVQPLLELQRSMSALPGKEQLLVESFESKDGHHLFLYPFEGRMVNEGLAMLVAYRLAKIRPFTFSISVNDYGFELLSDQEIPLEEGLEEDLFGIQNLHSDLQHSINLSEMARRKFRDIASIAGLTFRGFPGKMQKERHLQASASLFFNVFSDFDPGNLLLKQAYEEVMFQQLEINRLRSVLQRIDASEIKLIQLDRPSPFCFPLMVERLNSTQLSNEKLQDKIRKMIEGIHQGTGAIHKRSG